MLYKLYGLIGKNIKIIESSLKKIETKIIFIIEKINYEKNNRNKLEYI